MKRIVSMIAGVLFAVFLIGCSGEKEVVQAADSYSEAEPAKIETIAKKDSDAMRQILIKTIEGNRIIFELNHSTAANDLYQQLPIRIEIEDYREHEKIFYPPNQLDTSNTPLAEGPAGTLAYFEPWGNVAIFYGECGQYDGLYELGEAVAGMENSSELSGEILIDKFEENSVEEVEAENAAIDTVWIQIGEKKFSLKFYENDVSRTFINSLPLTITMSEMNGNEKYYYLPENLSAKESNPSEIKTGDLMLYGPNCLVLFYENFTTSYSYTPLGYVEDTTGFADALGRGDATVTFYKE